MTALMALVLAGLTALSPVAANAAPIDVIPEGPDRIVALEAGEAAPFSGQLFDAATALRWANWLRQYSLRLRLSGEFEEAARAIRQEYTADLIRIERERGALAEAALRESLRQREAELDRALNPPWYASTWFGVTMGVTGTLAVTALAAWAVSGP